MDVVLLEEDERLVDQDQAFGFGQPGLGAAEVG